jgi:hypothetical protein
MSEHKPMILRRGRQHCTYLYVVKCDLGFKDCQECVDLSAKYDCTITRAALYRAMPTGAEALPSFEEVHSFVISGAPHEDTVSPEPPSPRRVGRPRIERPEPKV